MGLRNKKAGFFSRERVSFQSHESLMKRSRDQQDSDAVLDYAERVEAQFGEMRSSGVAQNPAGAKAVTNNVWTDVGPLIFSINRGSGAGTRDSFAVLTHMAVLKAQFFRAAQEAQTAPVTDAVVRAVVVRDRRFAGEVTFTDEDLFNLSGRTVVQQPVLPLTGSSERFEIMSDVTRVLPARPVNEGAVNAFADAGASVFVEWRFVFDDPLRTVFTADNPSVTQAYSDNVWFLMTCDRDDVSCHWAFRHYWTDEYPV
jgi:hypothetical protein